MKIARPSIDGNYLLFGSVFIENTTIIYCCKEFTELAKQVRGLGSWGVFYYSLGANVVKLFTLVM